MKVAPEEPRVARMFDDVAKRYDTVNTMLSMGLDAYWRRRAQRALAAAGMTPGQPVLDLGCGTGKLGQLFPDARPMVGLDISLQMLTSARAKPLNDVQSFVLGSAFSLPLADASFAGATSAFVLRNLRDLPGAFAELYRVVQPGGQLALVDITGPQSPILRRVFDAYFGTVAPLLGAMVGEREAYRYLSRSLAQLPSPSALAGLLADAGFEQARATGMTFGMVTLWTGRKPTNPGSEGMA